MFNYARNANVVENLSLFWTSAVSPLIVQIFPALMFDASTIFHHIKANQTQQQMLLDAVSHRVH